MENKNTQENTWTWIFIFGILFLTMLEYVFLSNITGIMKYFFGAPELSSPFSYLPVIFAGIIFVYMIYRHIIINKAERENTKIIDDDIFQLNNFFRKAVQLKLLSVSNPAPIKRFIYESIYGPFNGPSNIETIFELIKLAHQYTMSDNNGIHDACLKLITGRRTLNSSMVYWQQPVTYNPDDWITLCQFLEENGCDMTEIFTDEKSA